MECSKGSILQYFRRLLSYHLCLRPLFCLFLSGRLKQVLLLFEFDIEWSGFKLIGIHTIQFLENLNKTHGGF